MTGGGVPIQGAVVIALDRWGRVLLQLRDRELPPARYPAMWAIPGGSARPGEPPDEAAIREFEEETGCLLERLEFFRVYRRTALPSLLVDVQHVYYDDPDLSESDVTVREGQAMRYFAPDEVPGLDLAPPHRAILDDFLASTAYRTLFH